MTLEKQRKTYKLPSLPLIRTINDFLNSPWFIFIMAILVVVANTFALELTVYWICTAIAVFTSIFGKDYLCYTPMLVGCYITPNFKNNPGRYDTSLFSFTGGGKTLFFMAGLIVVALLFRLLVDRNMRRSMFKTKRKLLWGMLILGVAYLLSGVGVAGYTAVAVKNIRFALLQFVAIFVPYFLLSGGIKWEDVSKRYCAYVGLMMGLVVGIELVGVYLTNDVFVNGVFVRENIFTGWGICNNMGVLISMAIPFAFYFIYRDERPVLFNMIAVALCVFSVLTTSRACILASTAIYIACLIIIFVKAPCRRVKIITVINIFLLIATLSVMGILTYKALTTAFATGFNSASRLRLYWLGFEIFSQDPVFGSSFYTLNDLAHGQNANWIWSQIGGFNEIIPGRWHNTIIQMLAACGIVGLVAYFIHRIQTVVLFAKKPTVEKMFIGLSIAVLLAMSLLDCHFFNIGPILFYSPALAFMEFGKGTPIEKKKNKRKEIQPTFENQIIGYYLWM